MERDRESTSFLIKFLDSFLHEKNIKWMLGIGTLILLGSSLRLVSMNWGDYSQVWKYGILLAYTAMIFVASEFTYFRLGLRRTGTVLMSLTVALVPLSFYALRWLDPAEPGGLWKISQQISLPLMVAVNFVLSAAATHRIFVHFLRKPQWTFEFAYLTLSLAGAVVPTAVSKLPNFWSYGIFAVLWLLFAAGTLKVNRHVFWLNEEERRPRIFGFFPILLLGAQFLVLFGAFLSNEIPMQWWGLGCALIAVPILLTADTVAKVFQQRTGNLVRPLPASIVAPLIVGLILCALGLGLSATGIPRPFALVPTAGLVAVAMGVVARRTGYQAFTWGGIVCVLIAYQFSPLFFLETAKLIVHQGAIAVKETRLPYSFYGLTYLPVLLTFTVASTLLHRSRLDVFAAPLRQAAIGLACLLLAAGFGHPKATFPVSTAMMGLFALQVFCFRHGMLLVPANLALIGAAWGFPTFQMMLTETPTIPASVRFMMALVAVLQLVPGRWIDRWSLSLNHSPLISTASAGLCQQFSLAVTFLTGLSCCLGTLVGIEAAPPFITSLLIGMVFIGHSLLSRDFKTGLTCLIYLNFLVGLYWVNLPYSWAFTLLASVCFLILQWSVGVVLQRMPTSAFSQAFAEPLLQFSQVSLVLLSIGGILPVLINSHWMIHEQPFLFWGASGAMAGWFFSAGWRNRDTRYLMGGFIVLLILPSAILIHQLGTRTGGNWLPLIWSISAITQLAFFNVAERCWNHQSDCRSEDSEGGWHPSRQLGMLVSVILLSVAIGTLFFLHLPARLAAVVALVALFRKRSSSHVLTTPTTLACVANWQGMCLLVHLLTGETGLVGQISQLQVFALLFPISLFAAASVLVIELSLWAMKCRQIPESEAVVLSLQRFLMFLLTCVMLAAQVVNPASEFTSWQAFAAAATFVCLGFSELVRACREQSVEAVWRSMAIGAVAIVYLFAFQVIEITLGGGMYSLLALCLIFWATGKATSRREHLNIMAEPLLTTSYWMPLVVVFVGIFLHAMNGSNLWQGSNSLALLISAGFYFFQGVEGHRVRNWMMSVGIVNVALALLWNELQWYDAQFFLIPIGASVLMLVELLRREIPESFHVPMSYIGALTILTSPTFEIIEGSWLHLLSLMILSVVILLLAMGLRIRALVYTGTAFLIADLIALVVRGGLDHPNLLWVAGVVLGLGVIGLAAYCEHHREKLMSRIRMISAELDTWR